MIDTQDSKEPRGRSEVYDAGVVACGDGRSLCSRFARGSSASEYETPDLRGFESLGLYVAVEAFVERVEARVGVWPRLVRWDGDKSLLP